MAARPCNGGACGPALTAAHLTTLFHLAPCADCCSKGQPVTLDIAVPTRVPASTEELRHMEAAHQVGGLCQERQA